MAEALSQAGLTQPLRGLKFPPEIQVPTLKLSSLPSAPEEAASNDSLHFLHTHRLLKASPGPAVYLLPNFHILISPSAPPPARTELPPAGTAAQALSLALPAPKSRPSIWCHTTARPPTLPSPSPSARKRRVSVLPLLQAKQLPGGLAPCLPEGRDSPLLVAVVVAKEGEDTLQSQQGDRCTCRIPSDTSIARKYPDDCGAVKMQPTSGAAHVSRRHLATWIVLLKVRQLRTAAQTPRAPGAELCDPIPVWDRLPCAPAPSTPGDCQDLGCCYSSEGSACYYGNTVTSRCTQDGHFNIAVSRNVTLPPLLLTSVHLAFGNDSDCDPTTATHAFVLFRFPFTSCGTTRRVTADRAVYENELVAARDVTTWSHGAITRDSIFRLRVSCSYSVSSNALPVDVRVLTLPPPLPETQPGPLSLELRLAKDENYSSYYGAGDYPVVKLLREPVYVEVSARHRADPGLGLLLRHCWATPGPDPLQWPQWSLLVKGCPYTGDNYRTRLIAVQTASGPPFPAPHRRFSILTFSFVDPAASQALGGPVYLHCSVSVCQPAGTPSCVLTCPARRRRSSDIHSHNSTASISSRGPMILLQDTKDASEKLRKYSRSAGDSRALWVAGLSGTLIVGALLVSYLAIRKRR
ncbi:zona pellucida sperm-binding protein 4 [Pteropus vampyrus]|uniref:Zona pellucida sperm-binding protein 4 n=1 Tax=Pteropus vampyrus TaxID=132908 RepID=A0A6P3RG57_PTEVA|nr:zona pellucida sperm-binding protein 4 [Pteropus vampyrus]